MRVAVTQFATTLNVQENLATCIRIINEAAVCKPSLIVLPEFCNTLFCYEQASYIDHNHAWNEALSITGPFLENIAEQAREHSCYIVLTVTLRQDASRDHKNSAIKSKISVTSCMFSPLGKLINQEDKKLLTGHESNFFVSANQESKIVTTPFGKLGILMGNDDLTFEDARQLTLQGAQLLCHSMSSFTLDQSRLHGPARACENKVFLATANKVGVLISEDRNKYIPQTSTIPQEYFIGVGLSQIVSSKGEVLAKMSDMEEGFIFTDLDLADGAFSNKCRPDGTDLIIQRRPELYQQLALSTAQNVDKINIPATANIAIFATYTSNEQAIEDVCHYIENNLSDIIQLPELFFIADKTITNNIDERSHIESLSKQLVSRISSELRAFQYVCTSLVIEGMHKAVIINKDGLFAAQQQLHFCQRYQWTELGDDLNIIELPLEQGKINVAMLTADDANIPEMFNVAALNNVHVLLLPFDIQEPCEVEYSLLSRASEYKICIVAASREKNFDNNLTNKIVSDNNHNIFNKNKVKRRKSTGFIANLTTDSTQLSQINSRKFNGCIDKIIVKHQHGKITKALIYPIAASHQVE